MSFVQHGDIKLNDNVNVVLQSWKMPDNEYTVNQKVTLHRLLSHRAGTIEGSYQYSNDKPIPTLLQVLNGESPAVNPPVEVTFVPGSEFIYSNLGYCVIEQILTDITGKPFYEIVKQTVFDPLNMNNSSFEQLLPAQRENNYSSGHYTLGSVVPGKYMITSNIAAGGIWTTAEDLAKFIIEAQLSFKSQSNKILSKQYMDIWDAPVTQISSEMSENYALGISNYRVEGYAYFGHGGSIDGFSGKIFASKDYGYGIVVLTNYNNSNEFAKKIINLAAKLYGWKGF